MEWNISLAQERVREILGGRPLLVASNREPYIHRTSPGGIRCERPAGGVASALDPILQAVGGTWIAWGSGSADWEVADSGGRVPVPPDAPRYTLRRLRLTDREVERYYYGFSNRTLWPLCHLLLEETRFERADWEVYCQVNQRFAEAILEEAAGPAPILWLHDYHLALVPSLIKAARPDIPIALFWHIPWPPYDLYRMLPWRREILSGLLGADLLGFHLAHYRDRFLECVRHEFPEAVIQGDGRITVGDRRTRLGVFPIGVDVDRFASWADTPRARRFIARLNRHLRRTPEHRLGIGVDRIDYTKGILKRLWAIERLFQQHPEHLDRFTFIQIASPSRTRIPIYRKLKEEVARTVASLNAQFGTPGWTPVLYIEQTVEQEMLAAYYRAADLAVVSSVYDGMNLVAKEYLASQLDGRGVLVLSEFAGAAEEIPEALIINPFDLDAFAEILHRALTLPLEERTAHCQAARRYLQEHTVYRWLAEILEALVAPLAPAD